MTAETPKEGDLRLWYIPQVGVGVPAYTQPIPDLKTGQAILDAIYQVALFELEHHVKPDYANMGGISRYEEDGDGGFGWFDVDDEDD